MKKFFFFPATILAIVLAFGAGGFSCIDAFASVGASAAVETAEPSAEAPEDLACLQSADSRQLDLWAQTLPAFDGRDYGYVTSQKNQYDKNICWAYAAIGAAEASILREGIDPTATKTNLNLDEYVAAYLRFNRDGQHDPLRLTTNDRFSEEWNKGDYAHNVFAVMSQGFSPVLQKTSIYSTDEAIKSFVSESEYFVQNYLRIPKTPEAIKRAVLEYGAVTIEYRAPDGYRNYFYTADGESTNHASIIVGWDDNVDKSQFRPDTPSESGAWIVKNSWGYDHGTDEKNTGTKCFYLSYDSYLTSNVYAVDLAMKEEYQNLYFYDGQITASATNYAADAQAAIYEAKLSSASRVERLKAVTVVSSQSDLNATVKVYRHLNVNPGNVNDAINVPDQGEPVAERSVRLARAGLHTIDLETPVELGQGEYFSIVVSCTSDYGTSIPLVCAVDSFESVNDMTYYQYKGEWTSYKGSANSYADTGRTNMSAKIRAVTDTVLRERNMGNDLQYARVEIANRLLYYARGQEQIPAVEVYFEGELLRAGQDYTVSIQNNDVPGMATVRIEGTGDYYGTRTTSFEVAKCKEPPGAMGGTVTVYNDVVWLHQIPISEDWEWINTDYVLDYGRTYFPVSIKYVGADRDFYQLTTCDFYVEKIDADPPDRTNISAADAEVVGTYSYTGEPILADVRVMLGETQLYEGEDFTVSYQNNTDAGHAAVTVTGKGQYYGEIDLTFETDKAVRRDFAVSLRNWTFGEDAAEPVLTGEGERAEVTYLYSAKEDGVYGAVKPTDAGTYWIKAVIAESQNYLSAESKAPFCIAQKDVGGLTATVEDTEFIYTGQALEPDVWVTDGQTQLAEGADYTVTYEDNIHAGAASAIVRGMGNYTGTLTASFAIGRAPAASVNTVIHVETFGSLSDLELPEGFAWEEGSLVMLSERRMKATAIYTGVDYDVERLEFEIIIGEQAEEGGDPAPAPAPDGGSDRNLIWLAVAIPGAALIAAGVGLSVALYRRKRR